ncbi:DMT family transporter [Hyphomonas sp.]|jgi:drug/metabolite transporter (DMT)-like permease|uniref:DMT family transporter n=1 Tax=Hyphomonas sp. TaxID=87 RepID=UPI0025C53995|nr:DMT family transporter [Hyphomonas sp.]MEE2920174.1 DMT family transporter [Pseudomonadota bacterium]
MTSSDISLPARREWLGVLMLAGGAVAIGFAPIGLRLGLDDLGPQAIAFWRYTFALPVLTALVLLVERRAPRKPNIYVILAGICFAVDIGFWHWALTLTSVSNATFIVNLGNVCVGFLAWLFLKERPAPIWFFAVLLAIGGASALSLGGTAEGGASFAGDQIAIVAAISVSGYFLCSKLARRTLNGLETLFWLTLVEVIVGAGMVMAFGESFLPEDLSGFAVPLFLGIVIHVVGQGLIITGLGSTPTSIAGVIILIQPVMAAAISWQLFNEPLTTLQAAGGMLILVAVWLAQRGHKVEPID